MRFTLRLASLAAVLLAGIGAVTVAATSSAGASAPHTSTITLRGATYTPRSVNGATDDYHCTLVDPHLTSNRYIVASHFFPNSIEVHHAILFMIPPNLAAQARADDRGNRGWTCFGESALPGTQALNQISNTPWLTAWAPGHGRDVEPAGTGVYFPKGSMVVMQVHYNLLRGDKPVRVKLNLTTVPASTHLAPLHLDLLPVVPNIPCPAGVSGPLCSRTAELANLAHRFGPGAVSFDNAIESVCGENPSDPPVGDTASCVWGLPSGQKLLRLTPHMHLLGRSMTIVLDPGTSHARTLLTVPNYDFNYQRSYTLSRPVVTHPGDTLGVTCTYDPTLAQELPALRKVAPHFVTWGDGSSDEMCLAIVQMIRA
jgi:hypothetical protein